MYPQVLHTNHKAATMASAIKCSKDVSLLILTTVAKTGRERELEKESESERAQAGSQRLSTEKDHKTPAGKS